MQVSAVVILKYEQQIWFHGLLACVEIQEDINYKLLEVNDSIKKLEVEAGLKLVQFQMSQVWCQCFNPLSLELAVLYIYIFHCKRYL